MPLLKFQPSYIVPDNGEKTNEENSDKDELVMAVLILGSNLNLLLNIVVQFEFVTTDSQYDMASYNPDR